MQWCEPSETQEVWLLLGWDILLSPGEEPEDEVENLPAQGQQCRVGTHQQVFKESISHFRIIAENHAGRDSRGETADLQHFREIPSLWKNWDLAGVRGGRWEQMAAQLLAARVCAWINSCGFFMEGHLQLNRSYGQTIKKLYSQEGISNWKRKTR